MILETISDACSLQARLAWQPLNRANDRRGQIVTWRYNNMLDAMINDSIHMHFKLAKSTTKRLLMSDQFMYRCLWLTGIFKVKQ